MDFMELENYTKGILRKFLPVASKLSMDIDDCFQEAYLIYHNCLQKYDGKRNFKSFYSKSLALHFYSKQDGKFKKALREPELFHEDEICILEDSNYGLFSVLFREADKDIAGLLYAIFTAPIDTLEELKCFNKKSYKKISSHF